jgi:catechol 2,3-dioxygenase-like lactoylglutathione lyase family enzyme
MTAQGAVPMNITFQSSVLFVQDIAASRRFYEELLGLKVEMDVGPSVGFEDGFTLWQVDHAFQTIYGRAPDAVQQLAKNYELHFETADAKAASTHLSEAGVEFVHPLREMPWGKLIFRVRDPDGHIVAVGEPMAAAIARLLGQGMSAEAVAKRTAMRPERADLVDSCASGRKEICDDSNRR